jgi:hypothetical protein
MEVLTIDTKSIGIGEAPVVHVDVDFASNPFADRINIIPTSGTTVSIPAMMFQASHQGNAIPLEDVEQRIEDAVEDDDEEAWATFLKIAPALRTTDRWLAES